MTHINAYYMDVEEKRKAVAVAQGALAAAEAALEAQQPKVVKPKVVKPKVVKVKEAPAEKVVKK